MSSLAFDKQGKPFAWHKRTAKLRVRLFRNPSARGTCCQVLDGVGSPLFVKQLHFELWKRDLDRHVAPADPSPHFAGWKLLEHYDALTPALPKARSEAA